MKRVVFLDYLRVVAIFMVLLVHACELFYFGEDGGFFIANASDVKWLVTIDSFCRSAVPLFVMASAYLLFPVTRPTGEFLRRRLLRVGVPFFLWSAAYVWAYGGKWSDLLFNFPSAAGHLWFVPMIAGLYLLMPLLSPWAERASEREVRGLLALWLATTVFPYLRQLCLAVSGEPSFGAVAYLWGECPWNGFGTFHYVTGFIGYVLLGFWFRRFAGEWSWRKTLAAALPLVVLGWAAVALPFYLRLPDGAYPLKDTYGFVVRLEMSWEYCSTGVAALTAGVFLLLRKLSAEGIWYRRLWLPLSTASFGVYLLHIFVLNLVAPHIRAVWPDAATIPLIALATFVVSSAAAILVRRIPRVGFWICG